MLCGKPISQPADKVTLYVPEHAFKAAAIDSQFGNVSVDGLQATQGSMNFDNGDASFTNCKFSALTLSSTFGDLTISSSTLDNCGITMSDGNLKLDSNQYQDSCSVTDKLGDVKLTAPSDILENLGLQLITGLGEIHLPEALAKTLPESDDDLTSYSLEGDKNATLTVICTDGDITILE